MYLSHDFSKLLHSDFVVRITDIEYMTISSRGVFLRDVNSVYFIENIQKIKEENRRKVLALAGCENSFYFISKSTRNIEEQESYYHQQNSLYGILDIDKCPLGLTAINKF